MTVVARRSLHAILCGATAALCGGCHRLPPPTPLDQLNAEQRRGHVVFQARCGQCHYDREDRPLHGPSLLGMYKQPYLPSGAPANDERLRATVLHGHGLMPAQTMIDPQDLDDLLSYLRTL